MSMVAVEVRVEEDDDDEEEDEEKEVVEEEEEFFRFFFLALADLEVGVVVARRRFFTAANCFLSSDDPSVPSYSALV
jgi:TATA-binding protein-associated factor Taf7|tara:strand:- start:2699 stop:2929 length:231 start_codon:yes stop_codon:yes gene_type:complete